LIVSVLVACLFPAAAFAAPAAPAATAGTAATAATAAAKRAALVAQVSKAQTRSEIARAVYQRRLQAGEILRDASGRFLAKPAAAAPKAERAKVEEPGARAAAPIAARAAQASSDREHAAAAVEPAEAVEKTLVAGPRAQKAAAAVAISSEKASEIATHFIDKQFKDLGWDARTEKRGWSRLPSMPTTNQFFGDPSHPVTGGGHIVSLIVRERPSANASLRQRIKFHMPWNKYKERQFDVFVDAQGTATQIGDPQSADVFTRLRGWMKPIGMMSQQDLGKTVAFVSGHAAAIIGSAVVPALIPVEAGGMALQVAYLRKAAARVAFDAHDAAVKDTAAWAKTQIAAGSAPSFPAAYTHYEDKLLENGKGGAPYPLKPHDFARMLEAQGF
jgi:hypothetical protein